MVNITFAGIRFKVQDKFQLDTHTTFKKKSLLFIQLSPDLKHNESRDNYHPQSTVKYGKKCKFQTPAFVFTW